MAQRFMGSADIVIDAPSLDRFAGFREGQEYVLVKAFIPESPVKAFDV